MLSTSVENPGEYETLTRRHLLRNPEEFPIHPTDLGKFQLDPNSNLAFVRHNLTHLANYCAKYPWLIDDLFVATIAHDSLNNLTEIMTEENLTGEESEILCTLYYLAERLIQITESKSADFTDDLEIPEMLDVFKQIALVGDISLDLVTANQIRADLEHIGQNYKSKKHFISINSDDRTMLIHLDSLRDFHQRRIVEPMLEEATRIRSLIRSKRYSQTELRKDLTTLIGEHGITDSRFTSADIFLQLILGHQDMPPRSGRIPETASGLEPLQAHRFIAAMDAIGPTSSDIFFDYGSGIGSQVILTRLLYGIPSGGVELIREFHDFAHKTAKDLKIDNVSLNLGDAASFEPPEASIFLLYNSFSGSTLNQVIQRLARLGQTKDLHVISASSSNFILRNVPWFKEIQLHNGDELDVALFRSVKC